MGGEFDTMLYFKEIGQADASTRGSVFSADQLAVKMFVSGLLAGGLRDPVRRRFDFVSGDIGRTRRGGKSARWLIPIGEPLTVKRPASDLRTKGSPFHKNFAPRFDTSIAGLF